MQHINNRSYLSPGSSRVPVCLHNLSACAPEIPLKLWVGQVAPANQILPVVHPTRTAKGTNTQVSKGWVMETLDLPGLTEWPESEQEQGAAGQMGTPVCAQ